MLANTINKKLVPVDGLEPSHPKAGDFESSERSNNIKRLPRLFLNKSLFLPLVYQLLTSEFVSLLGTFSSAILLQKENQQC